MAAAPKRPRKPRSKPPSPAAGHLSRSMRPTVGFASMTDQPGPEAGNPANVSYLHYDLARMLPLYHIVMDCLRGDVFIKQHDYMTLRNQGFVPFGEQVFLASNLYMGNTLPYIRQYLPQPNASDKSYENTERYRAYIMRAVFYNVTKQTLASLVGAVFLRAPVIRVPDALADLEMDATGGGVSLIQLGKQVVSYVLAYGRAGLLTDFPNTQGPVTVADRASGKYRPTIQVFAPWSVINWRSSWINGLRKLSLVVIAEQGILSDDGFKESTEEQYRVLRLVNGVYQSEIWRRDSDSVGMWSVYELTVPTDATGNPFDHIPFTFVGPQDNSLSVDYSPLYDLAALNIAHYRNSADYEESSYITGQPTPVFTGLTQEWVDNVMNGMIALGARAAVMLPLNGKAELLQAEPNSLPQEAMRHKESQMHALGAKLTEEKRIQRTATEAGFDEAASQSTLASSANNAAQGILWALQQACAFDGVAFTDDTLRYQLNTEFDLIKPSPEFRKQLLTEYESGGITWEEYRHSMHRAGIAFVDDAEARLSITANPPLQAALTLASVQANATNDKTNP